MQFPKKIGVKSTGDYSILDINTLKADTNKVTSGWYDDYHLLSTKTVNCLEQYCGIRRQLQESMVCNIYLGFVEFVF